MIRTRLQIQNLIYYAANRDAMSDDTKPCFGEQCKGCKDFYGCIEHFPYGCWGEK